MFFFPVSPFTVSFWDLSAQKAQHFECILYIKAGVVERVPPPR